MPESARILWLKKEFFFLQMLPIRKSKDKQISHISLTMPVVLTSITTADRVEVALISQDTTVEEGYLRLIRQIPSSFKETN